MIKKTYICEKANQYNTNKRIMFNPEEPTNTIEKDLFKAYAHHNGKGLYIVACYDHIITDNKKTLAPIENLITNIGYSFEINKPSSKEQHIVIATVHNQNGYYHICIMDKISKKSLQTLWPYGKLILRRTPAAWNDYYKEKNVMVYVLKHRNNALK